MGAARHIVIAGGSGFLGHALAAHLSARGARVVVLSRHGGPAGETRFNTPWATVAWDARTVGEWAAHLEGAAGLINLAGRSVDCVKTPDRCDEILRSRVEATRVLGEACRAAKAPPRVWIQMSTAHIYGDPPSARCDEASPTGYGLAPTVGVAWEGAFDGARLPGQRGVVLRTSFVIGRPNPGGAGALGTLGLLARAGLGGTVGSGTQGMSWLHEGDLHAIIDRALAEPAMSGVYVASAPTPVSNRDFMRALRRRAGGLGALGIGLAAPATLVRLGAPLVMRTDPELALYGRYVLPARLLAEGFTFTFPTLDAALADLYTKPPGRGAREAARA